MQSTSLSNNLFSIDNILNNFSRLPTDTTEKFEFYKTIRQIKKLLLTQQKELVNILSAIDDADSKLTKNNKRKQFHQEKFQEWHTKKQFRLNEVILKIKELKEFDSMVDPIAIDQVSFEVLHDRLAKLKLKKQGLMKKNEECTHTVALLESEVSLYQAELIRVSQLEKEAEKQQKNLLFTLQQQLGNNKALAPHHFELFESENKRVKDFMTTMEEESSNKMNILFNIKETFKIKMIKISDRIAQLKLEQKETEDGLDKLYSEENELNQQLQVKKSNLEKLSQCQDRKRKMQELEKEEDYIRAEILFHTEQNEKFYHELAVESITLETTLNNFAAKKIALQTEIEQINQLLDKKISFSSGQYISVDEVKKNLENGFRLSKRIPDKNLRAEVINNLIEHCDWKKIARINFTREISEVLISFYDAQIEMNGFNFNNCTQLFDRFLAEKGIATERYICIKDIEKVRAFDSLARFLYSYIWNILRGEPGPVIALIEWKNKINIAANETSTNSENKADEKYQYIKESMAVLIDLINKCPSNDVEEQIKYITDSIKIPSDMVDSHRFYTDILNILQYHCNETKFSSASKSFLQVLNAMSKEDVFVSNEKKLPEDCLHAEVLLLKFIVCDHLQECINNNQPLSLFPENHPILIGLSKLNCSNCYVTIDVLKALENKEILTTGEHFLRFGKDQEMHLSTVTKFFESIKFDLMNHTGKVPNKVIEFIDEKLALMEACTKNKFGEYHFTTVREFESTRKIVRPTSTRTSLSTQYSTRSPHQGNHLCEVYKNNKDKVHSSTQLINTAIQNESINHYCPTYNVNTPSELQDFEMENRTRSIKGHSEGHAHITKRPQSQKNFIPKKKQRNMTSSEQECFSANQREADEMQILADNGNSQKFKKCYSSIFTNPNDHLSLRDFETTMPRKVTVTHR